jgi:hypothetical protein
MSKWKHLQRRRKISAKGVYPESWDCVDCGVNTAPGSATRAEIDAAFELRTREGRQMVFGDRSEVFHVHDHVWKAAGLEPFAGCICVGCLEARLGRRLQPDDFADHPFNRMPGTPRLLEHQGRHVPLGEMPEELLSSKLPPLTP